MLSIFFVYKFKYYLKICLKWMNGNSNYLPFQLKFYPTNSTLPQNLNLNININKNIYFPTNNLKMAHLRTSFIQSCNSTCSMFPNWSGIVSGISSLFNSEEKDECTNNLNKSQNDLKIKHSRSLTLWRSCLFLNGHEQLVRSLINLNINSLSQLKETDSSDYSQTKNFVHVLQIKEQCIESLETVRSLNQLRDEGQLSPNSTCIGESVLTDEFSDYSDVEPYEL